MGRGIAARSPPLLLRSAAPLLPGAAIIGRTSHLGLVSASGLVPRVAVVDGGYVRWMAMPRRETGAHAVRASVSCEVAVVEERLEGS